MKDTKTGQLYSSKSKAGRAVAEEYGLDTNDNFVWYQVVLKDGKRFTTG